MRSYDKDWNRWGKFLFAFIIAGFLFMIVSLAVSPDEAHGATWKEDLQIQAIIKAEERQAKALEGILGELKEIKRAMK